MARKDYRGGAAKCTASGSVAVDATSIVLSGDTSGWPTGASGRLFNAIIDRGVAGKMEKVLCSDLTGGTLTIDTRGADGTDAVTHDAGCTIEHGVFASDFDDFAEHVYDTDRDDHEQYVLVDGSRPFSNVDDLVDDPESVGTSIAQGSAATFARSDHVHDIANNAVGTDQLQDDAVTQVELADASVGTAQLIDSNVTNAKMADDSIDSAELVDGAIDTVHFAAGAIGGALSVAATGGPVGGSAVVLGTINIPAQPDAYTLDAAAFWSGYNSDDDDTFSMSIKVATVVKGKVVNRHTGGANTRVAYGVPCINLVSIAASTAVAVTVSMIREGGVGNLTEEQAGFMVVKVYPKALAV